MNLLSNCHWEVRSYSMTHRMTLDQWFLNTSLKSADHGPYWPCNIAHIIFYPIIWAIWYGPYNKKHNIWTITARVRLSSMRWSNKPGIIVSRFACCHAIISNSFALIFCIHSSEWRWNSCSLWTWNTSLFLVFKKENRSGWNLSCNRLYFQYGQY